MPVKYTAVIPHIIINLQGQRQGLGVISAEKVYDKIIENKIKPPTGLRRWQDHLDLSESDILIGFTHAHLASKSSFDRVFQYKIMTYILPTNQYLARYRVRDTDICEKCHFSADTILHNIWQCQLVVPYVAKIIDFLKEKCYLQENIDCVQFVCGVKNNSALNHN